MPATVKHAACVLQIVMAALVIVLAFFFMPGNDNAETVLMRVRLLSQHAASGHDLCVGATIASHV